MLRPRLFAESGPLVRIFKDPFSAAIARLCMGASLFVLAVAAVQGVFGLSADRILDGTLYSTWVPLSLGFLACFVLRRKLGLRGHVVLDRDSRTLRKGGRSYPFDEFGAVVIDRRSALVRCGLARVTNRAGEKRARVSERLLDLVTHDNEVEVRRLSEMLARELDIQHIERLGSETIVRERADLETPIRLALGRTIAVPESVERPPDGCSLRVDGVETELQFKSPRRGGALLAPFVLFALALSTFFLSFVFGSSWTYTVLFFGGIAAGVFVLRRPVRSAITVSHDELRLSGLRLRSRMCLDKLEVVRSGEENVVMLGRNERLECATTIDTTAAWVRDELLIAIARTRTKSRPHIEGAYR